MLGIRRILNAVCWSALGGAFSAIPLLAQDQSQQPAELPPATYTANQYVDSNGCVFVRVGVDGNTAWVPRAAGDNSLVCGFEPSLNGTSTTEAIARPPAIQPVRRAPKPAARQTSAATSVSATQTVLPAEEVVLRRAASGAITAKTRIVPKHVAINRLNTTNVVVPQGYRRVWNDDRLNARRAEQNLEGRAQMLGIWTNTLPRDLLQSAQGRDNEIGTPVIYKAEPVGSADLSIGDVVVVDVAGNRKTQTVTRSSVSGTPVLASRSAPKDPSASQRFVLVGRHRDPGAAQAKARRIAKLGMPSRIGTRRTGISKTRSVQAGPFAEGEALRNAISALQQAGFPILAIR